MIFYKNPPSHITELISKQYLNFANKKKKTKFILINSERVILNTENSLAIKCPIIKENTKTNPIRKR